MTTLLLNETYSDELNELLRRVARRADSLQAASNCGRHHDRRVWLRAEFEVFEQFEREQPTALREHSHLAALG